MTTPRQTSGFTLLELLVVVLILSSLALATLTITRGADDQLRYDDTRTRLEAVRRAVLGPGAEGIGSIDELGGFVVDMGRLPVSIEDLLSGVVAGEDADVFEARVPLFSQTLDCAGFDDDAADDEAVIGGALFKGHRGSYLRTKVGADGYRDGWSNGLVQELDAPDYGWDYTLNLVDPEETTCLALSPLSLDLESIGADGINQGDEDIAEDVYGEDIVLTIDVFDWLVPLTGWDASLTSVTDDLPASTFVRLCVLVYVEGEGTYEGNPRWRHVLSDPLDISGLTSADSRLDLTFPVGVDGSMSVPSGEHAVVLLHSTTDDDDTEDLSSWSLYIENLDDAGVDTQPLVRRARFRAGLLPPPLHLALRAEHEG